MILGDLNRVSGDMGLANDDMRSAMSAWHLLVDRAKGPNLGPLHMELSKSKKLLVSSKSPKAIHFLWDIAGNPRPTCGERMTGTTLFSTQLEELTCKVCYSMMTSREKEPR